MAVRRYKERVAKNGGADRYGQFREGKQISPDSIAGRAIWHKWKSVAS